jgi:23S rRNA pseudouridine955/2504/2580 synthase
LTSIGDSVDEAIVRKMKDLGKPSVRLERIDEGAAEQRIDNFLFRLCKGVPKSHVYRILRSGEVRVNSRRVDAAYRLKMGDAVRIPPLRAAERGDKRPPPAGEFPVLWEDEELLAIDKPAGVAVHGGSGVSFGAIEQLRAARPEARFLELVHRLDRETSGVLLLAKKRSALVAMHELLRHGGVDKRYLALVKGRWTKGRLKVDLALEKHLNAAGERRVSVNSEGQHAVTLFAPRKAWDEFSLLEATLKTGRTHQIRVHLAHLGFPICGDDKYGDFPLNKALAKKGLKRMFLHAARLAFRHPLTAAAVTVESVLPPALENFVDGLGTP